MKTILVSILFCASLFATVQARATILPDSCGDDNIKFDVKVKALAEGKPNPNPAPAPPEAGKAQIIFIEYVDTNGQFFHNSDHALWHGWEMGRGHQRQFVLRCDG